MELTKEVESNFVNEHHCDTPLSHMVEESHGGVVEVESVDGKEQARAGEAETVGRANTDVSEAIGRGILVSALVVLLIRDTLEKLSPIPSKRFSQDASAVLSGGRNRVILDAKASQHAEVKNESVPGDGKPVPVGIWGRGLSEEITGVSRTDLVQEKDISLV